MCVQKSAFMCFCVFDRVSVCLYWYLRYYQYISCPLMMGVANAVRKHHPF